MDKNEFERAYAASSDALARYCYFRLPSKADGDEVIQETALAAWRARESCRSSERFKPWLIKIAVNKCNDFYRRRAKNLDLPLESLSELKETRSHFGVTVTETVRETLGNLGGQDREIIAMFYLLNIPQAEIARRLSVPLGTVKSRLHTARERFKSAYPSVIGGEIHVAPRKKESKKMSEKSKRLPETLPGYTVTARTDKPFAVKWEEVTGWFIVPKIGEKISWAMYDLPERKRTGLYKLSVTGRAEVHGIEGVSVTAEIKDGQDPAEKREFIAQLTDTHCRYLAESHTENGVRKFFTFLDGGEFLTNWGFGADNCGNQTNLTPRGKIKREGSVITAAKEEFLLDVAGRYDVEICGKTYDTICVIDIETYNPEVASVQYIDKSGRTVLWQRYNRDDWRIEFYKKPWSEKLPDNDRITVNGKTFVHWYDCITDYIL